MIGFEAWRATLRTLTTPGFLRRDQGEDALFASDYPRRSPDPEARTAAIEAAGFTVRIENGIAHLDASPGLYRALLTECALLAPKPGERGSARAENDPMTKDGNLVVESHLVAGEGARTTGDSSVTGRGEPMTEDHSVTGNGFRPTERTLYLYALARRLERAATPPERQPLAPVRWALKRLEAGDWAALERDLPPMLAVLQRQGQPLPSGLGFLLRRGLSNLGAGK